MGHAAKIDAVCVCVVGGGLNKSEGLIKDHTSNNKRVKTKNRLATTNRVRQTT